MAQRLLLINPSKPPSKRRAKKTTSRRPKTMAARKRRTAAQKAATRKLVAYNKARRRKPARRKNPVAKRKAYRTASASTPARRRRRAPATRRAPVRRRRNPIQKGIIDKMVMPAVTAAGGAIALDAIWANLPLLPDAIKTGPFRHVAKAGGAVVMGMLAEKVVSKKTAHEMATGALTVVAYNAGRELLSSVAPTLQLDGMGMYVGPGMGYANPALPASATERTQAINTSAAEMGYYAEAY